MKKSDLFVPPPGEDKKHRYQSPLEKRVKEVLNPLQEYITSQVAASVLLIVSTIVALLWANIDAVSTYYSYFTHLVIGLHIDKLVVEKSLQFWVNDVLLTLFFFFVGLEIKREFLVGELTNHKRAVFVLASAIGGMLIPALIYLLLNFHSASAVGWGIPMATDTAFALGVLSCFRKHVPKSIFTFVAALAIIDDIGAILVIAIFYTPHLNTLMLFAALLSTVILILMNYMGFRKPWAYFIIGLLVWSFIEAAGIHGTVAGILIAFTIPARPEKGPIAFINKIKKLISYFEKRKKQTAKILKDQEQHALLEEMHDMATKASTPLQRWESKLELPIALIVLPLFALVNVGIPFNFHLLDEVFTHTLSLGILLGLLIGKPLGIFLFGWSSLKLKWGKLPEDINLKTILSVSLLLAIGFTMSLFISNLSFSENANYLLIAKAAILISSLIAGLCGSALLLIFRRSKV